MNIDVQDDLCWRCGKKKEQKEMTKHHGIPQNMKPVKNITLPVCKKCHEEINSQDLRSMVAFAFRISKNSSETNNLIKKLLSNIQKNTEVQKICHAAQIVKKN